MPSYSELKPFLAQQALTSTFTGTASGHAVTNTDIARLPKMFRATQIENIKVVVVTAPTPTGLGLTFLNGTNTFGTVTVGTHTAGEVLDVTMTSSNANIAGGVEPTVTGLGTTTASAAQVGGVYDVWFEM
jgi:hypothetical protein